MADTTVTRGETVLFLGESHSLTFNERVVLRQGLPALICQPIFIPNAVSLGSVTNENGTFNANVRQALKATRLVVDDPSSEEDGMAVFSTTLKSWKSFRKFLQPPLLVICLGSYDVFLAVNQFPGDDFAIPDLPYLHPLADRLAGDSGAQRLGVDETTTWFISRTTPFQRALARLRASGFTRLAFLSIPPPTFDDAGTKKAVESLGGVANPARVRTPFRYKATLYLNALAAEICAAEDAAFLDSWPILTEGGIIRDGVLRDSAHLSDWAADEVLLKLVTPAALAMPRETDQTPETSETAEA